MDTKAGEKSGLLARLRLGSYFVDPKYARHRTSYFLQCMFVTCTMLFVLVLLDSVYQTVLIAALGASSCVAFSGPSLRASRPRCLIGGYVVGVVVGCGLSSLVGVAGSLSGMEEHTLQILFGAIAVGVAMFLMVTTETEHPPGVAIALGFVLNEWDFMTVIVVMAGICTISLVKELVRDRLIDLL